MSCKSSSCILDSPLPVTLRFVASLNKYGAIMPPSHKTPPHYEFLWMHWQLLQCFRRDLHSKIDNSAYLRIQWAKNELRSWTQFFDKEMDLRATFQERIHQKFCVAVGRSASIFAPAVFWKALHLNPSGKFSTLLSNIGPITANGDELIIDSHH